jgi:hypothetical protein
MRSIVIDGVGVWWDNHLDWFSWILIALRRGNRGIGGGSDFPDGVLFVPNAFVYNNSQGRELCDHDAQLVFFSSVIFAELDMQCFLMSPSS